jgi:putative nucleotidyltransferase with HDIG domain
MRMFMMVGLPGSGKGFFSKAISANTGASIFESDALESGVDVIFDATNVTAKNRVAFLNKIPEHIEKIAVVIATPVDDCLSNNRQRSRQIPDEIIIRMWKQFQMPGTHEGFDRVEIIDNNRQHQHVYDNVDVIGEIMDGFEQDNPHHTMTVGEHCKSAAHCVGEDVPLNIWLAARYHDLGKLYTKTFEDGRGNPSEIAHFYGHENVGAYEFMLYAFGTLADCNIVFICNAIQYHMRPYGFEGNKNAECKFREFVGQEIFDAVMAINKADRCAK